MRYSTTYPSPLGPLLLASDGTHLTGLWFEGQKHFGNGLTAAPIPNDTLPVLLRTRQWLDAYFDGNEPAIENLPLAPHGSAFRQAVWEILCKIPYGDTMTYSAIGQAVAAKLGRPGMASRAIGGAVGHNPISILIPCHRVIGSNGSLTGYAGGLERKVALLTLEGVDLKADIS